MTIFANKGETAWSQYNKALLDLLTGGQPFQPPNVMQPLAIAQRVEWDTQSAEYNLYLKQDIANSMPSWTPLYARSVGRSLPEEYQAFLDQLNSSLIRGSGIADQKTLDKLDKERRNLREKIVKLKKEVDSEWRDEVRSTAPSDLRTRAKWEEDLGYSAERENYEQQIQATEGAYFLAANNVGGDLKEIGRSIAALGSSIQQMPLPSTPELITLGRESWETFYRTFLDGDIFKFKNETAPVSFTVKEGQSETTNFSKSWNASVNVGWGLFFNAQGSVEHVDKTRHWEEETTEVTTSFKNIKPFNITRGQWFKGGLINRFLSKLEPSFWGQAGRLNVIPTQLILAHGLSLDIKTGHESSDFIFNRHSTSGGGGFSIGPFRLGGGGSSTTVFENTKVEKTATGLHIEDTSGRAMIVAVLSERPADLLATPPRPFFLEMSEHDLKAGQELRREWLSEVEEPATTLTLRTAA